MITCPAGQTKLFEPDLVLNFGYSTCISCPIRDKCTTRTPTGRTVNITQDEYDQQLFLGLTQTTEGRQKLRERVAIEHRLAHVLIFQIQSY